MDDIEYKHNVEFILEAVATESQEFNDKNKINNYTSSDIIGIATKHFSFYCVLESTHFFLTFPVGTSARYASEITKIITGIIHNNYFTVLEDHYFCSEKQKLLYGNVAIDAKYKHLLKEQGLAKCEICEQIVSLKDKTNKG